MNADGLHLFHCMEKSSSDILLWKCFCIVMNIPLRMKWKLQNKNILTSIYLGFT